MSDGPSSSFMVNCVSNHMVLEFLLFFKVSHYFCSALVTHYSSFNANLANDVKNLGQNFVFEACMAVCQAWVHVHSAIDARVFYYQCRRSTTCAFL